MKCNKCNEKISIFDKFCPNCGEKIPKIWEKIEIKEIKLPDIKIPKIKLTKELTYIIIALIFATSYIIVENKKINYKEKVRLEKQELIKENNNNRDECLNDTHKAYTESWNNNCKSINLPDNCALDIDIANALEKLDKQWQDECFKKYPVIK